MSCNEVISLLPARDEVREDPCRHAVSFQISAKSAHDTRFTRLLDRVAKEHVNKLSAHLLPAVLRRRGPRTLLQVATRGGRLRFDEQPQRRLDDLALPRPVADGTHGAAHQVRCDEHARYLQPAGDMCEGPDEDRDGGNALLFQGPADESDRPVADRSSGD